MRGDDVLLFGAVLLASVVPVWLALRIGAKFHRPATAGLAAFLSNYAMAVALASAFGVALDLARDPYYSPPPPGNFTLPLPWTIVLPVVQFWTCGPAASLVAAVIARSRKKRSLAESENEPLSYS